MRLLALLSVNQVLALFWMKLLDEIGGATALYKRSLTTIHLQKFVVIDTPSS
jgi:hypothetical protein